MLGLPKVPYFDMAIIITRSNDMIVLNVRHFINFTVVRLQKLALDTPIGNDREGFVLACCVQDIAVGAEVD